jgi:formate hydrogenlyase subunit 3/multisubunit Na+/H+ antiporter MnhD subunit
VLGAGLGLVPVARVLGGGEVAPLAFGWPVPGGALSLALDPLSAFFLAPILVLAALAACYGHGYLAGDAERHRRGPAWLWFDWLAASMALVVTARNGVLFLVAWEGMAVASYFLVVHHAEKQGVVRAGWLVLVATHLGTAFLLFVFARLAAEAGSFEFASWRAPAAGATGLFVLALVGFGAKAGLVPFHLWLPEAHPAAPSHVSALLSGAMLATGLYGVLRMLEILGPAPASWGALLVGAGLVSALGGVLLALAQRDLKRLLAYSSVENVGIVLAGIGLAWWLLAHGEPELASVALAGGLLHVWNHALFKGLLFLGAGSIGRGAGSLDLEALGGLLRRMPWTGTAFLVGAAAIAALPPLNGFVSEFLLYLAALRGVTTASLPPLAPLALIGGLGLAGGLAAASFAKAAGIALLGEPRTREAAAAREVGGAMRLAMVVLAAACALLGLAAPLGLAAVAAPVAQLLGGPERTARALGELVPILWTLSALGGAVVLTALALALLRRRALAGRSPRTAPTWDCGFGAASPRMQYTASSLAQPLTALFGAGVRERLERGAAGPESFVSEPRDPAEPAFRRLFGAVAALAERLAWLETGSTHLYVLYVVAAAFSVLLWKLA